MRIQTRSRIAAIGCFLVFFAVGIFANVTWDKPISITSAMVYSVFVIAWTLWTRYRVVHRWAQRMFVLIGLVMLLFILERTVKYSRFFLNQTVERMLWYVYYIPMLLLPLLSLMVALRLGKTDNERPSRAWNLLFLPAGLLIAGFLTNDFHSLAFRFAPDFAQWKQVYSHGILYGFAVAWIIGCVSAALALTVRASAMQRGYRQALMPAGVILLSLVGAAVYNSTNLQLLRLVNVPELFCFCVAGYWEACLQTGLIPSNTGYDLLFRASHLCAKIKDRTGAVVYETVPQQTDGVFSAQEQPISGGKVTWLKDMTTVTKQKEALEAALAALAERAKLQQAENALKEEREQIAAQTAIYETVNASLQPQMHRIERLLQHSQTNAQSRASDLLQVCVLGAFVKRKSNLMLLAAKGGLVPLRELELAFRESLSYLEKLGTEGTVFPAPEASLPAKSALYAYDEFEKVVEEKLPKLKTVSIRMEESNSAILFSLQLDATPLRLALEKEVGA